uniref:Peptide tyrosine arginine n=1 Tax=Lithobates sevosus TaxID=299683 RepID=PTYA_LITSE|nr:RecName: Full=Peptide tyrosine arginine [Lithobates sevosus]
YLKGCWTKSYPPKPCFSR